MEIYPKDTRNSPNSTIEIEQPNLKIGTIPEQTPHKENICMANEHMKRCPIARSLENCKCRQQWVNNRCTPVMARIQSTASNAAKVVSKGTLNLCQQEFSIVQLLWKTVQLFLIKLNMRLYNLAITLLGIHPNALKTHLPKDM